MRKIYLIIPALAVGLFSFSSSFASTPDGDPPAVEEVCNSVSGAAFGLCNAYCEAMDCDAANDDDDTTEPNANEAACLKVADKFTKMTGNPLPCEPQEVCPCWANAAEFKQRWDSFDAFSNCQPFDDATQCSLISRPSIILYEVIAQFPEGSTCSTVPIVKDRCYPIDPNTNEGVPVDITPAQFEACVKVLNDLNCQNVE